MTTRRRRARALSTFSVVAALAVASVASGATYYVGTGATCGDQPNDRASLGAALLSAALTTANDEIRLTRTLTYSNVALGLVDWHAGVAGTITIAGGFDHCDDTSASGRIALTGQAGNSLVSVTTSSQPTSVVTLRALELSSAGFRGVAIGDGGSVTLQNVWIHDNAGGVLVSSGASLSGDAATDITDNDLTFNGAGISCSGSGSYVGWSGRLMRNDSTQGGGNLYVGAGCLAELFGGALLEGQGEWPAATDDASFGGGVAVENGVLLAHGGSSRVTIRKHHVWIDGTGGGIHASGPNAVVTLFNTAIEDNSARIGGAAIHAENGATVILDRVAACPFVFSCSSIRGNVTVGGGLGEAVNVDDATVRVRRSVVVDNGLFEGSGFFEQELFEVSNGGVLELDGVLFARNSVRDLIHTSTAGISTAQYLTAAANQYELDDLVYDAYFGRADGGTISVYSSILDQTRGFEASAGGVVEGDCLLVDTLNGMPDDSYFVGAAQFVDAATGDYRQTAASWGVDFCDEQLVPWPGGSDVELQPRGSDMAGNPQGSPGIAGGLFDIGFDEAIGGSNLIFTDGFESGSTGAWSSVGP
jgi:hypothetical protein